MNVLPAVSSRSAARVDGTEARMAVDLAELMAEDRARDERAFVCN
jgi:hypothetical protein